MKTITSLTTTLLFSFTLLVPASTQAQISINEVFPAPKEDNEWIELYNSSNQEIDLNNWLLEDQLSSPSVIAQIENQTLPPQSFLTIELSSSKLNNSADGVTLKNSENKIIDQMSYESSKAGLSWSKNNSGIFELTQPTKNTTNIFPSPSPSPIVSPSPSPLITPDPTPITITPTDTPSPSATTPAIFLATPIPPSHPLPPHQPQQLIISFDSTPSANKNKFTHLVAKKLPKTALLSVILGGSWLLFSSSWKTHEKISHHRSTS